MVVSHGSLQSGVPLDANALHGLGGGSLCNHSDNPNARLVRNDGVSNGDGSGLFVESVRHISSGEFITVDYGKMFLSSNRSNIINQTIV